LGSKGAPHDPQNQQPTNDGRRHAFDRPRTAGCRRAGSGTTAIPSGTRTALVLGLDPHMKVVNMVKAGQPRAAIAKYWEPIRSSFTRAGGFTTASNLLG